MEGRGRVVRYAQAESPTKATKAKQRSIALCAAPLFLIALHLFLIVFPSLLNAAFFALLSAALIELGQRTCSLSRLDWPGSKLYASLCFCVGLIIFLHELLPVPATLSVSFP